MTKLHKFLDSLASDKAIQENLDRAKQAYEQKPFVVEYASQEKQARRWDWLPSVFSSIGMGIGFVWLLPNHPQVAILIGILIACVYEAIKVGVLGAGIRAVLQGRKFGYFLTAVGAALVLGSIGGALIGADAAYKVLENDKAVQAVALHDGRAGAELAQLDGTLKEMKERLSTFEAQNMVGAIVNGKKVDVISEKAKRSQSKQLDAITALEIEKANIIQASKVSATQAKEIAVASVGPYRYVALSLSLFIELLVVGLLLFKEYYLYQSNNEVELVSYAEAFTIDLAALASIARMQVRTVELGAGIGTAAPQKVGFQIANNKTETPTTQGGADAKHDAGAGVGGHTCEHCNNHYKPSVKWQRFCSSTCRDSHSSFKLKK